MRKLCKVLMVMVFMCVMFAQTISASAQEQDSSIPFVLVGDSRVVGIGTEESKDVIVSNANNYKELFVGKTDSNYIIGKVGEGLKWLKKNGMDEVNKYRGKSDILVIWMGTNDVYNADAYAEYINGLDGKILVVSCGPVDESKCRRYRYTITNDEVEKFNDTLKNSLNSSIKWMDISTLVTKDDIGKDGLHYTSSCYSKIYNEIVTKCNSEFSQKPRKKVRIEKEL